MTGTGALDWPIPTNMDLPLELASSVVENTNGRTRCGAKTMSEGALTCVAPTGGSASGVALQDSYSRAVRPPRPGHQSNACFTNMP